MFFKGSRYATVTEEVFTDAQKRSVRYKKIRIIAPTAGLQEHQVTQGERLDHIAHHYFRDAERFWRICDANEALWPDDLVASGEVLLIPASEG